MVDYKKVIVEELNTILPTKYELFCDASTETPCITYSEYNSFSNQEGDTIRYSTLQFIIKL